MSIKIGLAIAATLLGVATFGGIAAGEQAAARPKPLFIEDFAYEPPDSGKLIDRWIISGGLEPRMQLLRVASAYDPGLGRSVGRVMVEQGDALSGATAAAVAGKYVCDKDGSRALEMEAQPGGVAPSERAEMQIRYNRDTGIGELVHFDEAVWFRFAFKIAGDWPHDHPIGERPACRTVIHQIKQDSFKDGKSCSASPFFKIEARPLDDRVRFFAQMAWGAPCASPPAVQRAQICVTDDLPREIWNRVNVRLFPSHESGRVDVWLNGQHCGSYNGPMADAEFGARRGGVPVINAQPRFGLYRDRRAETQTIYFDRIAFWNVDPTGHPDWGLGGPAQ